MPKTLKQVRVFIITNLGEIEITHDAKMLENLNWANPKIQVKRVYG